MTEDPNNAAKPFSSDGGTGAPGKDKRGGASARKDARPDTGLPVHDDSDEDGFDALPGGSDGPERGAWSDRSASALPKKENRGLTLPLFVGLMAAISLVVSAVTAFAVSQILGGPGTGPDAVRQADLTAATESLQTTLRSDAAQARQALEARLAALESAMADSGGGVPDDLAERLTALDTAIAEVSGTTDTLSQRVSAVTGRVDVISARQPSASTLSPAEVEGLKTETVALSESLGAIQGRIDQLTNEIANAEARMSGRVRALEDQIPSLIPAQLSGQADAEEVSALRTRLAQKADAQALAGLEAQLTAKASAEDIAVLDSRIAALERDDAGQDARQAALAIAVASLSRAIASPAPFAEELETVAAIAPDMPQLAQLRGHAETGVPTEATLRTGFADVALKALQARPDGLAWYSRLWWSLKNIVAVRPVTESEGSSVGAVLSRAEARLNEGRLAAALAEIESLPVYSQTAIADWVAEAQARQTLNTLIAGLNERVIARLKS